MSGPVYGTAKGSPGSSQTSTGDRGGPSRFFYNSKASRAEREAGLAHLPPVKRSDGRETEIENPRLRTSPRRNDHPTVKPVDVMCWLVGLITPPGGLLLDPFVGSGTTGMAARQLGIPFIGSDIEPHYVEIASARIANAEPDATGPQQLEFGESWRAR